MVTCPFPDHLWHVHVIRVLLMGEHSDARCQQAENQGGSPSHAARSTVKKEATLEALQLLADGLPPCAALEVTFQQARAVCQMIAVFLSVSVGSAVRL